MTGEKIPKSIEKKIAAYREEQKLPSLDEERQRRQKERSKKYDVSFGPSQSLNMTIFCKQVFVFY